MVSKKSRKIKHSKTKRKYKQRGGTYDELIQAIKAENVDLEQIQTILTNANLTVDKIREALMIAIQKNKIKVVEILLQQYDNDDDNHMKVLNTKNEAGYSPLPFAMLEGNNEIVILLLQKGVNADGFNFDDFDFSGTNLHYTKISDGSFANAKFIDTNLSHTTFIDCDFTDADMTDADMTYAELTYCDFTAATLTNTDFTDATVINPDFTDANINDAIGIHTSYTTDIGPPRPPIISQDLNEFPTYSVNYNSDLSQISNIDDNTLDDNILDYDDSFDSGEWFTNENSPYRPSSPDFSPPDFPPSPPQLERRNELLRRNKVTLEKSNINPFLNSDLKGYDFIEMEDINFCSHIIDNPDNLLLFYGKQSTVITRKSLKKIMDEDDLKIVYKCVKKDGGFQPDGPYLNMVMIGLQGIMIPLKQLDEVITGKHQIFIVEPIVDGETKMKIASLDTWLGGNIVGANHCVEIPIRIGNISYLTNDVLQEQCVIKEQKQSVNNELLTKRSKIGGTRRKNIKKVNRNKSKRKIHKKIKK